MDIFSTHVLAKVVENLPTPSSFLLDTFFPNIQTSEKEEMLEDEFVFQPRLRSCRRGAAVVVGFLDALIVRHGRSD